MRPAFGRGLAGRATPLFRYLAPMKLALHWKIVVGLVAGAAVGIALNLWWTDATWADIGVQDPAAYLAGKPGDANAEAGAAAGAVRFVVRLNDLVGKLFVRCLRFIAVPIVLFSLIVGVASLGDLRKIGRIGGKTLAMFGATTVLAIVVGITASQTVRPGLFVSEETRAQLAAQRAGELAGRISGAPEVSAWKMILELVPQNPFEALAKAEMLQTIVLALALGIGLTMIPRERANVAVSFCEAMTDAITKIIELVMLAAPYAVFALIVPVAAGMGLEVLGALGVYSLVVVGGLAFILFAAYPAILWALTRRAGRVGYRRFFRAMAPAQLLAFSSSSSNATLPVTIECTHKRLGVSEEVTSFVCPLGATINMNGTALYQAVAATFLAQLYGIPLSLGDQVMLVLTATLVSIGSAGVPGASIVLMVIVLQSVHVPAEGIAVILGMDRVLDMCRTVVNISGDAMTAAVVASSEGQLAPATEESHE